MQAELNKVFNALDNSERILLQLMTEEDRKRFFEPIALVSAELSDYTRVYTETYLALVIGFESRTGELPDPVRRLAEVWADGLAKLVENQTDLR